MSKNDTEITGAQSLVLSLEKAGVTNIFGIPGGTILPAYDPLFDSPIRHILVRHEQAAGHAAEGYSYTSGKVGVCMATSGPGATNLVTPIADAYMDSVPLVAITGQVNSSAIGTDAFQEADISGITMPITKHSFLITNPDRIPTAIAKAFHLAQTGRPGPVLVDIAKDALAARTTFSWPQFLDLPGYHPTTKPHSKQIREALLLISAAKRPVLLIGGGVVRARADKELLNFAKLTTIPVVTTLMAKGSFPDSHPQNLGMGGMHGTVPAVVALQRADLIIAIGTRFDDRITGHLDSFAPNATIIHADIDPAEIGKNCYADLPIVGDARKVLKELTAQFLLNEKVPDYQSWWEELSTWCQQFPLAYATFSNDELAPQQVIQRISQITGPDAYYVSGVGQHQMWASQFIELEKSNHWINSGGLGTMGFSVPAAMGAKVGALQSVVWSIDGDGCFQMTSQELATCAINNIPIKVAIINNGNLGMVRQWQSLFYNKRYSNTKLHTDRIPDFVKLADAYGCYGLRCSQENQIDATIQKALSLNDAPVVIDFQVHPDAMVWPMVPAGQSNDMVTVAKNLAPVWDKEEL